ncbi:MAG: ABC transporter ATP-binding protein [Candidatus Diapherotrites archaeon]|uniref:ABC transporter ATP-binding protein n=1 Tax=Candidatus Iainarchaeum sp. TaxID=3101447 RepID=A0A938YUW0_9ARCH|nr:ABC transporter ATP-binding protein [Candidatus Diapherotrites archaeon]
MESAVLELKDVWKVYKMDAVGVPALRGISLKVNKGEFVAVVGASGSGKSTALNMIGALDIPTKGLVFLDGNEITSLPESSLARIRGKKIGFVFQTFNLYPTLNVFDNIALPMRIHEFTEQEIEKQVRELAELVGLKHRAKHRPSQLSGGERQRVAIARALAAEPSMVLADEPTGNLDTKTSREILNLFVDLNRKEGKTIVMVTHEPGLAAYAGRIVELRDGKIVFDGKSQKWRNTK